jgi:hypothetical protein
MPHTAGAQAGGRSEGLRTPTLVLLLLYRSVRIGNR